MFSITICIFMITQDDNSGFVKISTVFGICKHVECERVFWNKTFAHLSARFFESIISGTLKLWGLSSVSKCSKFLVLNSPETSDMTKRDHDTLEKSAVIQIWALFGTRKHDDKKCFGSLHLNSLKTCYHQSTCSQIVLRFQIWLRKTFLGSICLWKMKK